MAPMRLGRLEGEAFDAALRDREQRERDDRLSRLARAPDDAGAASAKATASAAEVWRLERDVARLAAFHLAVDRSRAWRVIQWLRRPFGREW
ncbi:MAG TPA: hypothetical protein VOA87_08250 [Thermoanaerobaculia bacterium]|nr:hypothetical protein [Thermoanaerobaculia bacterium]